MSNAYVVYFDTVPDAPRPDRDSVVSHCLALRGLEEKGALIAAGPFTDGQGGMVVARFDDLEAARAYAESDAFVRGGWRTFRIFGWEHSHRGNGHLGVLEAEPVCPMCGRATS